jgi:hypothetical protein
MENFHALRSAGFTRVMYILPRRYTYCTTFLCLRQQVFTFVILRVHLFVILREHLFVILRMHLFVILRELATEGSRPGLSK